MMIAGMSPGQQAGMSPGMPSSQQGMSPGMPASSQHGMSPGPPATPGSQCAMSQPSPGSMSQQQQQQQMGMHTTPPAGQMGAMSGPSGGNMGNQGPGYMHGQLANMAVMQGNMSQDSNSMMSPYPPYNNMYPAHMMNQQHCSNQWQPMSQTGGQPGIMSQPMCGPHQYYDQSGQPMPMMVPEKRERQSPLVQVPHISQSQIPARGKGRRQGPDPGPNDMGHNYVPNGAMGHQTGGYMPHPAQSPMQYPFDPYGSGPYGPPVFPQQNPMYMPMLPPANYPRVPPHGHNNQQAPSAQPHQHPHPHPHQQHPLGQGTCNVPQPAGSNQHGMHHHPGNKMQMSPSCNQVSSTSDIKQQGQGHVQGHGHGHDHLGPEPNLNSISTDNLIDNLSSISMENINHNIALSPTALCNRSTTSQTSSRITTPFHEGGGKASATPSVMDTSNMVVNDMSSMLTQLAEENAYLTMKR